MIPVIAFVLVRALIHLFCIAWINHQTTAVRSLLLLELDSHSRVARAGCPTSDRRAQGVHVDAARGAGAANRRLPGRVHGVRRADFAAVDSRAAAERPGRCRPARRALRPGLIVNCSAFDPRPGANWFAFDCHSGALSFGARFDAGYVLQVSQCVKTKFRFALQKQLGFNKFHTNYSQSLQTMTCNS